MTPKDKIISVVPTHDAPPATTREISEAAVRRYGPISPGARSEHDYAYGVLKELVDEGLVQRHGAGKGPAIRWALKS